MLLQLGDKGDNVKYLQYGLHILCCSPNGFDGEFGNGTLTAVKKFQSKYGLVSDGIVGDVTWNTLKNEIATIQAQLNKKGCSVGTVDGIAGPATYNAVISFQNKNGLTADGYYGNATKSAVISFQSAKGLTADGEVGLATWNALFSSSSNSTGSSYTRLLKVTSPLMYGEDIKAVQNKLNSLGYNCGTADGYYGNATKNAVISFQSAKGIDTDGVVGPTTWKLLFNSSSNGSDYSRILKVTSPLMYGDDVKTVQNKLNSLGYNCGTADGYYGNATKSAVISFQSAKGFTADGEVGPATWNALFNSYSSSGSGTLPGGSIKVFIDAGHGGTDPGAVGNGLKEKDIVLSIATKLGALLNGRGISIKYSRTTDTYLSLEERARLANAWGADLFVSIHANSATSSVRGTECYTHPTANTATKTLSGNISRAIASKFGISNRGHKEANFAVLRLSNMPAILVETAFISNSSDASLLKNRQDDFVVAIANTIMNTSTISNAKERIVVSASEYDIGRFKYNFIEPAIKQLKEFKNNSKYKYDKITWLIANNRYSDEDLNNFKDTAKKLDVNLGFFNNTEALINYINLDRSFCKIANFIVFSHGIEGSVELGYSPLNSINELSLTINDIRKINANSFDSSIFTHFYSCNTATEVDGNSVAKEWFNQGLGPIQAAVKKTDYSIILGKTEEEINNHLAQSKEKNYNENGALYYPGLGKDAYWKYFS